MVIVDVDVDDDVLALTAPSSPLVNSSRSSCLRRRSTGDRSAAITDDAAAAISQAETLSLVRFLVSSSVEERLLSPN